MSDITTIDTESAEASLHEVQRRLEYTFETPQHLELALTHSTFASEARLPSSNERLEFLGDSVLNISVTQRLYHAYPSEDEGSLSRRRQAIISNRSLALVAKQIGLTDCLRLGVGQRSDTGTVPDSIAANTVEALLGALFLDGGMSAVERVFGQRFDSWVSQSTPHGDPKSRLQEYCHQHQLPVPEYTLLSEDGPDHAKHYTWRVRVGDTSVAATATSKTKAQRSAAALLIEQLEIT